MEATALLEAHAERGPHAVGVTTEAVPDPRDPSRVLPVDVWYPADPHGAPGEPADHPYGQPHAAAQGAAPLPGPCPVITFSHGNRGLRRQSTFLTTHLASWGFVVVAPDHLGNTFLEMAAISDEDQLVAAHRAARAARPGDVLAALARVEAGSPAWPRVDSQRIGALGHSFGGWTSFKLPRLAPHIRAVCGLAPATEPFVGRKAFEPDEFPLAGGPASLVVPGLDDTLVYMEPSIWPLYRRLEAPRALVGIRGADHFHFCDGLELLHANHEKTPRPGQPQRPKPGHELLDSPRMHRLVCGLVTAFFERVLVAGENDPFAATGGLDAAALRRFDPALVRLTTEDE